MTYPPTADDLQLERYMAQFKGDEMMETTQERKSEITAAEFVAGGYAAKVAAGECVVRDIEEGSRVISMSTEGEFRDVYAVSMWATDCEWMDEVSSDTLFAVEWLTPPPTPIDDTLFDKNGYSEK